MTDSPMRDADQVHEEFRTYRRKFENVLTALDELRDVDELDVRWEERGKLAARLGEVTNQLTDLGCELDDLARAGRLPIAWQLRPGATAAENEATPSREAERAFRFNWQDAPEGIAKWLLVAVIPASQRPDIIPRLSEATNKFTEVDLTIQVNGIEVDAGALLDRIERTMNYRAQVEAQRLLDGIGRFDDLQNLLDRVQLAAKTAVRQRLRAAQFELHDIDD